MTDIRKNYCTHAIEFFKETAKQIDQKEPMLGSQFEYFLINILTSSIKFILPDNGEIFDNTDYNPSFFDLLHLPFPICSLEFTADEKLFLEETGLNFSGKRISLCFDPHKLPKDVFEQLEFLTMANNLSEVLPSKCLAIIAIFDIPQYQMWSSSAGIVCLDLEKDRPILVKKDFLNSQLSQGAQRAHERLSRGCIKPNKYGLPVTYLPFPQRNHLVGISEQKSIENLYLDTVDEIRTAYQFLAAINCSNVSTEIISSPKALNQKREGKGKTPLFEYHILNISAVNGGSTGNKLHAGGTHASPRTHLRRGHLRRLGERFGNKVLWINATLVNPLGDDKLIVKDYNFKK